MVGGRLAHQAIHWPDVSCNRELFSEARDVIALFGKEWGVYSFEVQDTPPKLNAPNGQPYEFGLEHRPAKKNYAHSEIWAYVDGEHHTKAPHARVKKEFRDLVSKAIRVDIEAPPG